MVSVFVDDELGVALRYYALAARAEPSSNVGPIIGEDIDALFGDRGRPRQASIGGFNLDGSSRHASVNTQDKLAERVASIMMNEMSCPGLTTFSEVNSKSFFSKHLYSQLPASTADRADGACEYFGYVEAVGKGDNTGVLWDKDIWDQLNGNDDVVEHYYSKFGRYNAVKLTHRTSKKKILMIGVHLPHKGREAKANAYRLLAKFMEDDGADCDAVVVSGDFNSPPKKVLDDILPKGYTLACNNNSRGALGSTFSAKKQGKFIDNVAISDDNGFLAHRQRQGGADGDLTLFRDIKTFDHHPFVENMELIND